MSFKNYLLSALIALLMCNCSLIAQTSCDGCDQEVKITGFVDASYFFDMASSENTFGFDQVEIDVEKSIGNIGFVRADVEWTNGGTGFDAEQGYLTLSSSCMGHLSFTFGKFNAPIGFELLDAPDMYQFSHALVFNYGLPTNLTGAMLTAPLMQFMDIAFYACNGWDNITDNNKDKTFGGRLGINVGKLMGKPDMATFGLSFIQGAEDDLLGDKQTVFDLDITFNPADNFSIGGEFNSGSEDIADESVKWSGFLFMCHYDFNDWLGATFRYDSFDDQDGTRLPSGIVEKRSAITFAPTFTLGDGMGALIEYRMDSSDQKVFTDSDGAATDSQSTIAFEMTYTF